jgi:(p)ppGpp synthase/HD superfamily hydrolase
MSVNYFDNYQIKRILARLRYHKVDERLIERVEVDINFEANYEKFLRLSRPAKSSLVHDCLQFATQAHQGQTYRKQTDSHGLQLVPYLNHPIILAIKALELGFDEIIVAGCLVHDTFKATKITQEYLTQELDPRVSRIVLGHNKLEGENKVETLNRILTTQSFESKAIKVLDKWHSLLRSFTLYDPGYQERLVIELQNVVLPHITDEFAEISDDCTFLIGCVNQLRKPLIANR